MAANHIVWGQVGEDASWVNCPVDRCYCQIIGTSSISSNYIPLICWRGTCIATHIGFQSDIFSIGVSIFIRFNSYAADWCRDNSDILGIWFS